jgi:DNA-binding transcriptional LysR family regulator
MDFDARLLNGIGILVAVVEAKNFARAATNIGLTPSGVSRAIARLEEQLGVRLLQRTSRAVTLTSEGRRFYDAVVPLMAGLAEAASEAGGAKASAKGTLRVATDALVARNLLAPALPRFFDANPAVAVDLVVTDRLGDLVADGFDVAIRFGDPEPSALVTRKLGDTRVVTVASPAYLARRGRPAHPRDLPDHECIHFRNPMTGRPYAWEFRRGKEVLEVEVSGRLIVNDSATGFAACRAGLGICQPLESDLRALGDHGLVDLFPDWPDERFALHAYFPTRRHTPRKVRVLVDFVAGLVGR